MVHHSGGTPPDRARVRSRIEKRNARPIEWTRVTKTDLKVLEQIIKQVKENATRAISIRVPIADLERARQIAERTGVGSQAVLKQAIREGLKKTG